MKERKLFENLFFKFKNMNKKGSEINYSDRKRKQFFE